MIKLILIFFVGLINISNAIDWLCDDYYKLEQKKLGVTWGKHSLLKRPELKNDISKAVKSASLKYQMDPFLILATIWKESRFDIKVIKLKHKGPKGSLGLMQILPHGICNKNCDLNTIEGQIDCGTKCLAQSIKYCNGNISQGFSNYISGNGCRNINAGKRRYVLYLKLKGVFDGSTD